MQQGRPLDRVGAFCDRFGLRMPVLMAPMASACPPALAVAVANAGGMGGCGCMVTQPQGIAEWIANFRAGSNGAVQLNLWIPDPPPRRDAAHEAEVRRFLGGFGPEVPVEAAEVRMPDFAAQCAAMLAARPVAISSVMGLYPPEFVAQMKAQGIAWMATVTTVAEALAAEAAGADVIVAQGAEAGGHRGAFEAAEAERQAVGLFALVPAVADAVRLPIVAAGSIADGRTAAAALLLGASAVQLGTALLRSPEAAIHPAWAAALEGLRPEDTMLSRAFSGRAGRGVATAYARAAASPDAPAPAPYPVQRGLTAPMRRAGAESNNVERMQAWAGQAARLARVEPAGDIVTRVWSEAQALLSAA